MPSLSMLSTAAGRRWCVGALLALLSGLARAAMGLGEIAATAEDGPVTLYYPTQAAEQPLVRGRFRFDAAADGAPAPALANSRLVVISHGSGAAPWVHADLARSLVAAGYVVAMPAHRGDNASDDGRPGPDSWTLRPAEVSRAIDALGRDPRFAPWLKLDKVGMYGMSAGGHTALSLAGGRWSPAGFKQHCEAHLAEDFQTCVGLITQLTGGPLDGIKQWLALAVIRHRFADATPREHVDPRIVAVVAGVPVAADFDMASLAHPRVPLALITARQDRWLAPRFHGDRVVQACQTCEHLVDLPTGGHGALLSPAPPGLVGLVGQLLNDPPGYDRAAMTPVVNRRIVDFLGRYLLP